MLTCVALLLCNPLTQLVRATRRSDVAQRRPAQRAARLGSLQVLEDTRPGMRANVRVAESAAVLQSMHALTLHLAALQRGCA